MSSWYSNIVGATSSKISSLQRSLLSSEADGDTEDDTHVCRVLRSYYTTKGAPLPGWLPPDPKGPPPVQAIYAQPQPGARYGGLQPQQGPPQGGLSSLWDNNPSQQPQDVQSLRRGRGAPPPMRGNDPRNSPFRNSEPMGGPDVQARPLPSQRAGSNQSPYGSSATPPAGNVGGSAQDRLRQKLWGGTRTTSPSGSGPFQPPAQGGGGGYDARGGGGPYGGSEGGGAYSAGGYGGRQGGVPPRRPPGGLPSGPRMR